MSIPGDVPLDAFGDMSISTAVNHLRAGCRSAAVGDPGLHLAEAPRLLADGHVTEAALACCRVLEWQPDHAGALQHLGIIVHQAGKHAEAVELLKRAAAMTPNDAVLQCHLGDAYRATGRLVEAEIRLRLAVALNPDFAEAFISLGSILLGQGRRGEAAMAFRRALELRPGASRARIGLARLAGELQSSTPPTPPEAARMHFGLAEELERRGRCLEARISYERAVTLRPDWALPPLRLAALHRRWDEHGAAIAWCERALAAEPGSAEAYGDLAITLCEAGRPEAALAALEAARRLMPGNPLFPRYKGPTLLSLGRWQEGWAEEGGGGHRDDETAWPGEAWDGRALDGAAILLHAEGGLGDTLQMLRYLPRVKERGGRVLLAVDPTCHRLLADFPAIDEICRPGPLPRFDWHAPLMRLPALFATTPQTIPPPLARLAIPPASPVAASIGAVGGYKVGLAWAGDSQGPDDQRRSCPVAFLEPILGIPGCSFFGLQKASGETDLAMGERDQRILRLGEAFGDLADAAAAMARLDLVITVDAAIAHLAGTMGKSVWILLPYAADWRWLRDRTDSPWYPSATLFRQARPGDWQELMLRVARALQGRVVGDRHRSPR